ncbi:hypothetical protein ccbrp13_34180 [Ktedonobacteria bacterium brp13]|nr:hypothetical protein ccbrp13_34180 [Ktedonobacteria bacterium brp13]
MFYDYGLWAGLHLLINLFWLAILIALIVAVVQLLSRSSVASFFTHSEETHYRSPQQPNSQPRFSAMEILRQRYAHGEIDAVTFDQMRERIEASEHSHV